MDPPVWPDDVQRAFREFFGDADASLSGIFSPALDVEENDNEFALHVEVSGVKPDDVEVSIEENVLTIAGARRPLVVAAVPSSGGRLAILRRAPR